MGTKQAKKGEVCQILEESKWLRKRVAGAGSSYFSLYSCLVFMVFHRAWSLSPSVCVSLSLFTFEPRLEVAALQFANFFTKDLTSDCLSDLS